MALALRRVGGGMAAWVTGCVIVAGALMLWDAATCLWFFNGLFRLDIQAAQHPGFGSGVLRSLLGLFLGSPAWPLWAVTVGASVAALAKLGRYRVAALFGIGFGPVLTTILEGGSPVSGKPLTLLVPVWLLVIVADIFLTWGVAWCIVEMWTAWRETGKLRKLGGVPVIGWPEGVAAIFAGGNQVGGGGEWLLNFQGMFKRQAEWNAAKAQENFRRAVWGQLPGMVKTRISVKLLSHNWSRGFVGPVNW